MATAPADRAAVILCGGESSRMGRPKALLPFGPEALLVRVLRICREACGEIVVAAAEGQDLPPLPDGVRVVRDAAPGQGPLEGLAAGLAAVRAPAAFCVSCDAPFLRPALVRRMFDALGESAAVQAVVEGRVQPLGAVYRASLAPKAARLLREGKRAAAALADGEPVRLLREPEVREADPDLASFRGCDTPEEYAAALRAAGWGA